MPVRAESKQHVNSKKSGKAPKAKVGKNTRKRVSYKLKYEETLARCNQCEDRLLRTLAEFDNMKKRSERDRAHLIESANSELILKILPVLDDLERSLKTVHSGAEQRQGIELIVRKLSGLLKDQGVSSFESVGKPFDVAYHDALMMIENSDFPSGTVIEEHEKGYCMHDKVLRHARVIVSK